MYKLLLIRKYLFKRRIAWVSLAAVMMCTAMVIVVISVMGGWLRMFKESFHGLSGDVIVQGKLLTGFAKYEDMIAAIENLPMVEAAIPVVKTFGVINIANEQSSGVQVIGYPIEQVGRVNRFPQSLYLQHNQYTEAANDKAASLSSAARDALMKKADESAARASFKLPLPPDVYRSRFPGGPKNPDGSPKNDPAQWPGLIAGSGVLNIKKDKDGNFINREEFLYRLPVYMTMPRISSGQRIDQTATASRNYWIADDSRTNLWQYDSTTVYVPFDVLQKDLGMASKEVENIQTGKTEMTPARANEIDIKCKPGTDLLAARDAIEKAVMKVQGIPEDALESTGPLDMVIETWEQSQKTYLSAIENEKSLVTFLFSLISLVAVFLIFCIFYMIVVEKTRDIGIIKSVGATSEGVAAIFLGYGLVIGIVGSMLGFGLGYIIVTYINEIHGWLGRFLGIVIWNPEVYAFDKIPNQVNPFETTIILIVAVIASVVGALVPAIRAARLNPVESLRWE